MPNGRYDSVRKLHQFQFTCCVELGTLQQLALSTIVSVYSDHRDEWIQAMPCIPKDLRKEILKRLMYKGVLDNDLFSLCVDLERRVWDLRSIRSNFNDGSCPVLAKVQSVDLLRLSYPSCSALAMSEMLKNFSHLRLLEIIHTDTMDDSVLEVVSANCPLLEVLNVKGTSVTDQGMLVLKDSKLELIELDISYTMISQVGIDYLKTGPMKESLKLLRFKHCKQLGSAKLVCDIILGFPNLKDYSFDFNGEGNDNEEIEWALGQLPGPSPGQNVFFNIPL